MEEKEENKISKYNSGVFIIQRLHNLWLDANEHSRRGQFSKWNKDLDRIWLEIARDLSDDKLNDKKDKKGNEIKGYKSKFDNFDKQLTETGALSDNFGGDFEAPTKKDIENRNEQYKILMEKEFFLRRLENETGKGTKFEDLSEDDMD